MKKIISLFLVGVLSITSFTTRASAYESVLKENGNSISGDRLNIDDFGYETFGVKAWVTKTVIRSASTIIRAGGDAAYWAIKQVGFDGRKIRKIINRKDQIADALDKFVNDFNRAEVELTTTLKVYLISQGFDEDIANMVTLFVNFML